MGSGQVSCASRKAMQKNGPAIVDGGNGNPQDAMEKVHRLCAVQLPVDSHANIHSVPHVLSYNIITDSGFCDRNAFSCAMAKYLEEAAEQSKMVRCLGIGCMEIHLFVVDL